MKTNKIGLFFLIFGVPLSLVYFLAIQGKTQYQILPILGEKVVQNGDTLDATIKEFSYKDIDGNSFTNEDIKGKFTIWGVLTTSCPSSDCPILFGQFKKLVYEEIKGDRIFGDTLKIITHVISTDSNKKVNLKKFTKNFDIDANAWKFIEGDDRRIYDFKFKNGTNLGNTKIENYLSRDTDEGSFSYINHTRTFLIQKDLNDTYFQYLFLLIDNKSRIRGLYRGNFSPDIKRILDESRLLLKEYGIK